MPLPSAEDAIGIQAKVYLGLEEGGFDKEPRFISKEINSQHEGDGELFLCQKDGKSYLLFVSTYENQGNATLAYGVIYLDDEAGIQVIDAYENNYSMKDSVTEDTGGKMYLEDAGPDFGEHIMPWIANCQALIIEDTTVEQRFVVSEDSQFDVHSYFEKYMVYEDAHDIAYIPIISQVYNDPHDDCPMVGTENIDFDGDGNLEIMTLEDLGENGGDGACRITIKNLAGNVLLKEDVSFFQLRVHKDRSAEICYKGQVVSAFSAERFGLLASGQDKTSHIANGNQYSDAYEAISKEEVIDADKYSGAKWNPEEKVLYLKAYISGLEGHSSTIGYGVTKVHFESGENSCVWSESEFYREG